MLFRSLTRLLVAVGFAALVPLAGASTLGDIAREMQPGEWRVLNQAGDGSGYTFGDLLIACNGSDCGDNILNYADKGLWNPNTREIHFIGKGANGKELKHISYSEATNRWTREAKPYWDCSPGEGCIGHGYEHSTIDPATGDVFWRQFYSSSYYRWSRGSKTWSALPAGPSPECCVALEWFPEMAGFLVVAKGQVHLYNRSLGTWRQLASGVAMGDYHTVATYNPVHKVVVFGGGNSGGDYGGARDLFKIDSAGRISRIAAPPANVGILQSVFTVDPASGKYLLLTSDGRFFEYDVPSNAWAALNSSGVQAFSSSLSNRIEYRVAVPISTHGVVAFLVTDRSDSSSRVLLYKHASAPAAPPLDTTPPSPPTGLIAE